MGICITWEHSQEGVRYVPVMTCDGCGQRIPDAAQGNYSWLVWLTGAHGGQPVDGELAFTHKRCTRLFEHANPAPEHARWYCWELRDFPVYLGTNLNVDWTTRLPWLRALTGRDGVRPPDAAWQILRAAVFLRDENICRYCGTVTDAPHCDHVVPVSRGGANTMSNLVTACPTCNMSKHDKTPDEWLGGAWHGVD